MHQTLRFVFIHIFLKSIESIRYAIPAVLSVYQVMENYDETGRPIR